MAKYTVNDAAIRHARKLIDARRYVLRSRWGDVQPTAADGTRYLKTHTWEEYGTWHLGLTEAPARRPSGATLSSSATSVACTAWGSSPATTGQPSGATRTSS